MRPNNPFAHPLRVLKINKNSIERPDTGIKLTYTKTKGTGNTKEYLFLLSSVLNIAAGIYW